MATIIDALIITLGLDGRAFKKGVSDANKDVKGLDENARKPRKSLEDLSKTLIAVGGAFAALRGVSNFLDGIIKSDAALGRASRNLGTSTENIDAWGRAIAQAGGDSHEATQLFDKLNQSLTRMSSGQGPDEFMQKFAAFGGVSLRDAKGNLRDTSDLLVEFVGNFEKLAVPRQMKYGMLQSAGISEGAINLILQGRDALERTMATERERGLLSRKQADADAAHEKQLAKVQASVRQLGRSIVTVLLPAMEKMAEIAESATEWLSKNEVAATGLSIVIGGGLLSSLVAVAAPFAGFLRLLASPSILTAAAAIAAVSAAVVQLTSDYEAWGEGNESIVDWGMWAEQIKTVRDMVSSLTDAIGNLLTRVGRLAETKLFSEEQWDFIGEVTAKLMALGGSEEARGALRTQGALSPARAKPAPMATAPVAEQGDIVAKLMRLGMSRENAIAIASNLKVESQFNPAAVGDSGKAYGLAQWHPDRQANFKRLMGKDIQGSSVDEQLQFLVHELTKGSERGAFEKLQLAQGVAAKAAAVSRYYERPADREGEMMRRGALAQRYEATGSFDTVKQGAARPTQQNSVTINGGITVQSNSADPNQVAAAIPKEVQRRPIIQQLASGAF